MDRLTLRYDYDETPPVDDFGWLAAEVRTDRFAGRGGFWVQWQDVVEFADELKQFPLPADAPVSGQWGVSMLEGNDLFLRIEVAAANSTGDLVVRIEIADHVAPDNRVRVSSVIGYAELASFASALGGVMAKSVDEAVLTAK